MHDMKVVNILKTFSRNELKSFERFLSSPFFNANQNCTKFYKELVKFYPDFRSDSLHSEYMFSRVYPGKTFNKHAMWNLSSGLERLAEEFLTQTSLKDQPFEKLKLIISELGLRRLDKLYLKKLGEAEKLVQNTLIDDVYFLKLVELKEAKSSYLQKVKGMESITPEINIEKADVYTLDYLVNINRVIGNIMSYLRTTNLKQPFDLAKDFVPIINLEKIREISRKKNYKYAGLIEFYCNLILCSTYPENESYYLFAKKFFMKNHMLFDKHEKRNLAVNLINFCLQKYMLGDPEYANELFLIVKFRVKHDLAAYEAGKLSKAFYNLAVFSAATVNEISWARRFMEKYTPLLYEEYQEETKNLAYSYIYFSSGKYNEVLNSLKKFRYSDVIDKVHVKVLIARTYFEMKEYELLRYHIDSTKHFLNKNKKLGNHIRDVHMNFINYLYSIVAAAENKDPYRLIEIEEKLKNENKVNYKVWLLEKLNEIKK